MSQQFDLPEENIQQDGGFSYQEKSLIASIIGSLLLYAIYGRQLAQRYQAGNLDSAEAFRFWGTAVVVLIVLVVLVEVVTQIVFNVLNTIVTKEEEDPSFEDERDKLIDLKATTYQFTIFGIGFLLAMGAIAVGRPPTTMFVLLLLFTMLAGIAGSVAKLYLYRRGF